MARHLLDGRLVKATPIRLNESDRLHATEPPSEVTGLMASIWVPTLRIWRYSVNGHSVDPGTAVAIEATPEWAGAP